MKKILALLIAVTGVYAAITKATLPYVIANYSSPKTFMIDGNDIALRNVLNQTVDSTNRFRDTLAKYLYARSFTGTGTLVYSNSPTITTPIIGSITGVSDAVSIASGDTLKSDWIKATNSNLATTSIGYANITDGLATFLSFADFSATSGTVANLNGTTGAFSQGVEATDFRASDSLKGSTISSTGRITGTDIDVRDSVISVSGKFTGNVSIGDARSVDSTSIIGAFRVEHGTSKTASIITGSSDNGSTQRNILSFTHRTNGTPASGFGAMVDFSYINASDTKYTTSEIVGRRGENDGDGYLDINIYSSSSRKTIATISNDLLNIAGNITSDSSRVDAEYRSIITVSSSGTATLTKEFSFVWVTASGVTLNLPDANGSGFSLETCSSGYSVNVSIAAAGDILNGIPCSPSPGFALGATCGAASNYHGLCAKFIDCANNLWCVFPTYY